MHPKIEQESLPDVLDGAAMKASSVQRRRLLLFAVSTGILCALFSGALTNWVRFAFSKQRDTYLVLVPFISAYLIRTHRQSLLCEFTGSIGLAFVPGAVAALSLLALSGFASPLDRLSLQIFALLNLIVASALVSFGIGFLRQIAFPTIFLFFAVPIPEIIASQIEIFLQHTSAEAAYWLMSLANIPMIRDGVNFRLPNLYIEVAKECSGYNSTFSLFMVSLVAGYLFLKSNSKRTILSIAVIPLAILRNGFRVTTLAALCVYRDPEWINSPLHHSGGPIFFALSLFPFLGLLWLLRKLEIAKEKSLKSQ